MLTFKDKENFSKESLHIGSLYLYKYGSTFDGLPAVVYLGRNEQGRYLFYHVSTVLVVEDYYNNVILLYNEDIVLESLYTMAKALLQRKLIKDQIRQFSTLPTIVAEFPLLTEEELVKLFAKKKLMGVDNLTLPQGKNFEYIDNPQVIKPKELQIGHCYIGKRHLGTYEEGNPAFIYLGRTKDGCYSYLDIGGLSGTSYKGFEPAIQFAVKYKDSRLIVVKTPKALYKPVYYNQLSDFDVSDLLRAYKLIK